MTEELQAQAGMLANRVRKLQRHRRKWARRIGTNAYRIYDRDIPEVPIAVDYYAGHVVVAEYVGVHGGDRDERWIHTMADAVALGVDIDRERVVVKERRKLRSREQYARQNMAPRSVIVQENDFGVRC